MSRTDELRPAVVLKRRGDAHAELEYKVQFTDTNEKVWVSELSGLNVELREFVALDIGCDGGWRHQRRLPVFRIFFRVGTLLWTNPYDLPMDHRDQGGVARNRDLLRTLARSS